METIKNTGDINNLVENKIIGEIELENSEIKFYGSNNILFCDSGIKIKKSHINFLGNNTIIYLSYTEKDYVLEIYARHNSTIFIGKNNEIGVPLNINVQEAQNVIIGEDNVIGNDVFLRTIDTYPIYDANNGQRINHSESIFIGDHVWIDHFNYISRGAKIGSGAIVGIHSFIPPMAVVKSNTYVIGNPARAIDEDVFFTKNFVGLFKEEDTENNSVYESDVFIYDFVNNETLSMVNIDNILKGLSVDDRLDFVQKLFVKNKRKNRFAII
ncbi:MAG: acetyltransferase [Methanobrevibacter sp.]|nr:acetyltransferase [Methanobrevibacter sp.]